MLDGEMIMSHSFFPTHVTTNEAENGGPVELIDAHYASITNTGMDGARCPSAVTFVHILVS